MSLIFSIFVTVIGLVGAFANVEMLLTFHKKKANCTFLQKCSKLVICQFCIQVTMLAVISVEAWYSIQYQQHEHSLSMLLVFVYISLEFYSTTFFILAHEHVKQRSSSKLLNSAASKLLISAALCLELIHSVIYYSAICYPELTWILLLWNIIALCLAQVLVVLFAEPTKYSELQNKSSSNGRESLVRRMINGPGKSFVILFLITAFGILLIVWREALVEAFFHLNLFIYSFLFGIAIPAGFSDLFNSRCGQGLRQEILGVAII